ncbi:hypothetical protein CRENBAI_023796 [Crenichthys baileyi]|uniref:Uncharacterized protein n=1 Tax=Crenichthys baileyi TaxID=28760 RepID=A0AAV9SPN4_9TELE
MPCTSPTRVSEVLYRHTPNLLPGSSMGFQRRVLLVWLYSLLPGSNIGFRDQSCSFGRASLPLTAFKLQHLHQADFEHQHPALPEAAVAVLYLISRGADEIVQVHLLCVPVPEFSNKDFQVDSPRVPVPEVTDKGVQGAGFQGSCIGAASLQDSVLCRTKSRSTD